MTQRDRLIELLSGKSLDTKDDVDFVVDCLITRGVVVPPCEEGDTICCIDKDKTISKWYVVGFHNFFSIGWACKVRNNHNKWSYIERDVEFSDFGNSVFTTRKAAIEKINRE